MIEYNSVVEGINTGDQTTVVFTLDEGGKRKKYRFQVSADSFKEIKQKTQKLHTEHQETIYGAKGGPEYPYPV